MLFRDLRDSPGLPRGLRWGLCLYLLNGPLSIEEISAKYETDPIPPSGRVDSALRLPQRKRRLKKLRSRLPGDLASLVAAGWLVLNDDKYALTQKGREKASQGLQGALSVMSGISRRVRALALPSTASKLTILIQILLAAVKLPAGLLSGSVGLLNDSLDTILDLLSGFFVYLGVRFNRERLASTLLVVCMTGTGAFSLYEAVRCFFTPQIPRVQWFPIFAAGLSAFAGIILWQYQRYVGRQSGSLAFVAESVDSRNHVFVAFAVTAGLVASLLRFGLLDAIVGLVVALLIVWSAVQLAVELVRASSGRDADLSRYRLWLGEVFHHASERFLRTVMLSLADGGEVRSRSDLIEGVRRAIDFRGNPWMKAAGLDHQLATDAMLEEVLEESIRGGYILDGNPVRVTETGRQFLARQAGHRGRSRS